MAHHNLCTLAAHVFDLGGRVAKKAGSAAVSVTETGLNSLPGASKWWSTNSLRAVSGSLAPAKGRTVTCVLPTARPFYIRA